MNESAVRAVIARHLSSNQVFDFEIQEELASFGDFAGPVLVDLIKNGNDDERLFAVVAIRHVGARTEDTLADLIPLLHGDRLTSVTVTETFAYFGSLAAGLVPLIEHHLDSPDEFRRLITAGAILRIQPSHRRAFEVLEEALDGNEMQQKHGLHYLGNLGPAARPVLGKVERLLASDDQFVRTLAEEAIKKIAGTTPTIC